jgi:anti-anti-sigma factor
VDLQKTVAPVVVVLPQEIDITNADSMRGRVRSALSPGVTVVIADMMSTAFCDIAGCRNLLCAHDDAGACGAQLRLVIQPGGVRRVLKLLGFDRLLAVYPSLDSARKGDSAGVRALMDFDAHNKSRSGLAVTREARIVGSSGN